MILAVCSGVRTELTSFAHVEPPYHRNYDADHQNCCRGHDAKNNTTSAHYVLKLIPGLQRRPLAGVPGLPRRRP